MKAKRPRIQVIAEPIAAQHSGKNAANVLLIFRFFPDLIFAPAQLICGDFVKTGYDNCGQTRMGLACRVIRIMRLRYMIVKIVHKGWA